jgi:rhamnosyltransferase
MKPERMSEEAPAVSIIILTLNGGETIDDCLASVFNQEIDLSYEVIAIDSGSTDSTMDVLKGYDVRLHQIEPEDFNFGRTKNMGAEMANGEYLIYLSQDAIPADRSWLRNMIGPFSDPGVHAVQGVEKSEEGFYWWRKGFFWYTSEIRRWMEEYQQIGLSCVALAIRREAWERIRFDIVPFGEDKLYQKKATEAGMKIVLSRDASVLHAHSYSWKSLRNRVINEGLGSKVSGQEYTFLDMVMDLLNVRAFRMLFEGITNGEIRSIAEVAYPFVRPIFIYKGFHHATEYQRDG